jgi:hypothetical protein
MQSKNTHSNNEKEIWVKRSVNGPVERLPASKFAAENNITWTESLIFEVESPDVQFKPFNIAIETLKHKISRQLERHANSLVITFKDNQVGYTVVASRRIGGGEYVTAYAGVVKNSFKESDFGEYSFLIHDSDGQGSIIIDAKDHRNIGSYIQYAPSSLRNYNFSGVNASDVATANLQACFFTCDSKPLLVFKSTRTIREGEELYLDYGDNYWRYPNKKMPLLFLRDGTAVLSSCYSLKVIALIFQLPDNTHLTLEVPVEKLRTLFEKEFSFYYKENEIFCYSYEDFKKHYVDDKATYVFLPEPSKIIKVESDNKQEVKDLTVQLSKTAGLPRIPTLSVEERTEISTGRIRNMWHTFFGINSEKVQRHITADKLSHALYEIGATIANKEADLYEKRQLMNSEPQDQLLILERYHSIKKYVVSSGNDLFMNPLQALLLIVVALNHLPLELIDKLPDVDTASMTMGKLSVCFPNGSQFCSDQAIFEIIDIYNLVQKGEAFAFNYCSGLLGNVCPEPEPIKEDAEIIFKTKCLSRINSSPALQSLLDIDMHDGQKDIMIEEINGLQDGSNTGESNTSRQLQAPDRGALFFEKSSSTFGGFFKQFKSMGIDTGNFDPRMKEIEFLRIEGRM